MSSLIRFSPEHDRRSEINRFLYWLKTNENSSNSCKITSKLSFKIFSVIASYVAVYPFLKPAQLASTNKVLQVLFPIGECATWGTLYGWAAVNIIDSIATNKNLNSELQVRIISSKIYWLSIGLSGIICQIPSAYITYKYNEGNLFWTIFSPTIYSFFTTFSLHLLTRKLLYSKTFLTRWIYRDPNKVAIFQAKHNIKKILTQTLYKLFQKEDNIIDALHPLYICNRESASNFKRTFFITAQIGAEIILNKQQTKSVFIKRGNQLIKISNLTGSILKSSFEGYLVYTGSYLITTNKAINCIIGAVVALPNLYLSFESSHSSSQKILKYLSSICKEVDCQNDFFYRYQDSIVPSAVLPIVFMLTFFGMGSFTRIVKDIIGFDSLLTAPYSASIIAFVGLVLLNSMLAYSEMIIKKFQNLTCTIYEAEIILISLKIKKIITYIDTLSDETFCHLMEELDSLQSIHGHSFLDEIQKNKNFINIKKVIDANLKEDKELNELANYNDNDVIIER